MNKNKLFGKLCSIYSSIFKIDSELITLVEKHNSGPNGNLYDIRNELLLYNSNYKFNTILHSDYNSGIGALLRLFTKKAWLLAHSKYIFLNDNFMPMAYMKLKPEAYATQVWHGVGAFKKFGNSSITDESLRKEVVSLNKNINLIPVSSEEIVPFYAEAFGVNKEKVKALGVPQTDYFFKEHDITSIRERFDKLHPECIGKKLVLYAPTFRDDKAKNNSLLSHFDFSKFNEVLGDEYRLLLRPHPQITTDTSKIPEKSYTDATKAESVRDLLLITDILITDYSSISVEFAMLNRPIYLFAYDLEDYIKTDRGFYFDFEEQAPGPIVKTSDELVKSIKEKNWNLDKVSSFAKLHNQFTDGNSAKRIVEYIMTNKK